jgi:hypothetical protein
VTKIVCPRCEGPVGLCDCATLSRRGFISMLGLTGLALAVPKIVPAFGVGLPEMLAESHFLATVIVHNAVTIKAEEFRREYAALLNQAFAANLDSNLELTNVRYDAERVAYEALLAKFDQMPQGWTRIA